MRRPVFSSLVLLAALALGGCAREPCRCLFDAPEYGEAEMRTRKGVRMIVDNQFNYLSLSLEHANPVLTVEDSIMAVDAVGNLQRVLAWAVFDLRQYNKHLRSYRYDAESLASIEEEVDRMEKDLSMKSDSEDLTREDLEILLEPGLKQRILECITKEPVQE